jgi:hypothetical protein
VDYIAPDEWQPPRLARAGRAAARKPVRLVGTAVR